MLDLDIFNQLKIALLKKYQETFPEWKRSIHDFRGKEIANFQQLLQEKVHSRISEKWFYTHLKPIQNKKLPRMDMLDLLSQFLDYSDWEDFKKTQQSIFEKPVKIIQEASPKSIFSPQRIGFLALGFLSIVLIWSAFFNKKSNMYTFCFSDTDTQQMLINEVIEIEIFQDNESPIIQKIDSKGCFQWSTQPEKITFAVNAPYFKSDTITRFLQKEKKEEIILLKRDDYAYMIHLFSTSNIIDWKKRRQQLGEMLADDALIFQVEKDNKAMGLAMLNKEEFIDRMTLPINSLKNIEVIHSLYKDGKIYRLRFILEE